jgi:hypothetical protein
MQIDKPDPQRQCAVTVFVLALSVVAIVNAWRAQRTVYGDETWIVERLRSGPYTAHAVAAPPFFFIVARSVLRFVGDSDFRLRLPAQAFALLCAAAPVVFYPLTKRWLSFRAALTWALLLAFSSPYAFYGTRVKQYTSEAFVATLLLCLALWVLDSPGKRERRIVFGVVAVIAAATTHCGPFVLATTGAMALARAVLGWRLRDTAVRSSLSFCVEHLGFAAVFVAAWVLYLSPGEEVRQQWGDLVEYFNRTGERFFFDGTVSFIVDRTRHWLGQYLNLTPFAMYAAALAGVTWLAARRSTLSRGCRLILVIGGIAPVVAVLGASAMKAYPYGEVRLMAFAFPGLAMLIAAVSDYAMALPRVGWAARTVGFVFLGAYVVHGFVLESYNRTYMRAFDQSHLWKIVSQNVRSGDVIVAWRTQGVPLLYHHPELADRTKLWAERTSLPGPLPTPTWPEATGAVWIVEGITNPLIESVPDDWVLTFGIEDEGVIVHRYERSARPPESNDSAGDRRRSSVGNLPTID